MELECKDGSKVAVSIWFTKAENSDDNELCIAVIEPVQRVVSHLLLDEFGMVMATDDMALSLFHCKEDSFVGHNIIKWIPNILWPDTVEDLNEVFKKNSAFFKTLSNFHASGEKDTENYGFE